MHFFCRTLNRQKNAVSGFVYLRSGRLNKQMVNTTILKSLLTRLESVFNGDGEIRAPFEVAVSCLQKLGQQMKELVLSEVPEGKHLHAYNKYPKKVFLEYGTALKRCEICLYVDSGKTFFARNVHDGYSVYPLKTAEDLNSFVGYVRVFGELQTFANAFNYKNRTQTDIDTMFSRWFETESSSSSLPHSNDKMYNLVSDLMTELTTFWGKDVQTDDRTIHMHLGPISSLRKMKVMEMEIVPWVYTTVHLYEAENKVCVCAMIDEFHSNPILVISNHGVPDAVAFNSFLRSIMSLFKIVQFDAKQQFSEFRMWYSDLLASSRL